MAIDQISFGVAVIDQTFCGHCIVYNYSPVFSSSCYTVDSHTRIHARLLQPTYVTYPASRWRSTFKQCRYIFDFSICLCVYLFTGFKNVGVPCGTRSTFVKRITKPVGKCRRASLSRRINTGMQLVACNRVSSLTATQRNPTLQEKLLNNDTKLLPVTAYPIYLNMKK